MTADPRDAAIRVSCPVVAVPRFGALEPHASGQRMLLARNGLFVQMTEHFVEGLVHVSTLVDDFYRFEDAARVLLGERSGRMFRLGDAVRVRVLRVDMDRRQVELGVEEVLETVRRSRDARGPGRSDARPKKSRVTGTRRRDGRRERSAKKRGRG